MAVVNQLNLNVGTEQNPNFVLHDINDKRISTTAVTTATHLLTCNSGVTSIAPITADNLASVLGASRRKANGANIDEMTTPYIHIYTVNAAETNECQGIFPKGSGTATAFSGAFDLEVKYVANRISQTMQDNGVGGIWWRYYNTSSQIWSVWYKVTTTPGSV
jgi:hypothetical protein